MSRPLSWRTVLRGGLLGVVALAAVLGSVSPAWAAASEPTLRLVAEAAPHDPHAVELLATLQVPAAPASSKPASLAGAQVSFSVHVSQFAGAPLLALGTATTNAAGVATLTYRPTWTGRQACRDRRERGGDHPRLRDGELLRCQRLPPLRRHGGGRTARWHDRPGGGRSVARYRGRALDHPDRRRRAGEPRAQPQTAIACEPVGVSRSGLGEQGLSSVSPTPAPGGSAAEGRAGEMGASRATRRVPPGAHGPCGRPAHDPRRLVAAQVATWSGREGSLDPGQVGT